MTGVQSCALPICFPVTIRRVDLRERLIVEHDKMYACKDNIQKMFEAINAHDFVVLKISDSNCYEHPIVKSIDQRMWFYMVRLFNLEKYMLCTEYKKLESQICDYDFPEFTLANAEAWLSSVKLLVYENVQKMIEAVYNGVVDGTYYTGSGLSGREKKKRNNNGIDSVFILSTNDYNGVAWYSHRPTITDDLERLCYIMDGKMLPDYTIKQTMRREKRWESENEYFRIRVCKNGNTHYWLKDNIRERLNFYGAKRGVIGRDIKIKIFEE